MFFHQQKFSLLKLATLAGLFLTLSSTPLLLLASDADVYDLQHFIEIRRSKFDAYSRSLEKRSGIFGNKTKKDLLKSHDALADIVETDNRIIGLLNQKIDFKKYEKTKSNYDFFESNEQIQKLQLATDTLAKQVDFLTASNVSLKRKATLLKWTVYILGGLFLLLFLQKWKRKRIHNTI